MLLIAGVNKFPAIFRYIIGTRHEVLNLPGCRSKPDYDYNTQRTTYNMAVKI